MKNFDEWWDSISKHTCSFDAFDEETLSYIRVVAHAAWCEAQKASRDKIAALEEQMEAIGAGGVTRGQKLMNRREQ